MKYAHPILTPVLALAVVVAVVTISVTSAHANAPFTLLDGPNLTMGSTGQNVVQLQSLLSELGYLNVPVTIPFGYFGPMTQSALAQYQASAGISPAAGYFGPITQQYMRAYLTAKGWLAMLVQYGA